MKELGERYRPPPDSVIDSQAETIAAPNRPPTDESRIQSSSEVQDLLNIKRRTLYDWEKRAQVSPIRRLRSKYYTYEMVREMVEARNRALELHRQKNTQHRKPRLSLEVSQVGELFEKHSSQLTDVQKEVIELRYGLKNGETLTQQKVAEILGRRDKDVVSAIERSAILKFLSTDRQLIGPVVKETKKRKPGRVLSKAEIIRKSFENYQHMLTPLQREVIQLRFGSKDEKPMSQRQIAQALNRIQSVIARTEKRATQKLLAAQEAKASTLKPEDLLSVADTEKILGGIGRHARVRWEKRAKVSPVIINGRKYYTREMVPRMAKVRDQSAERNKEKQARAWSPGAPRRIENTRILFEHYSYLLTPLQKKVIQYRYGLGENKKPMSQTQIAQALNRRGQSSISNIEKRATQKLLAAQEQERSRLAEESGVLLADDMIRSPNVISLSDSFTDNSAELSERLLSPLPSPEELLIRNEELNELKIAFDSLDPVFRTIIQSHYLEGKSLAEIAESLGIPKSRLHRRHRIALGKLRHFMERLRFAASSELEMSFHYRFYLLPFSAVVFNDNSTFSLIKSENGQAKVLVVADYNIQINNDQKQQKPQPPSTNTATSQNNYQTQIFELNERAQDKNSQLVYSSAATDKKFQVSFIKPYSEGAIFQVSSNEPIGLRFLPFPSLCRQILEHQPQSSPAKHIPDIDEQISSRLRKLKRPYSSEIAISQNSAMLVDDTFFVAFSNFYGKDESIKLCVAAQRHLLMSKEKYLEEGKISLVDHDLIKGIGGKYFTLNPYDEKNVYVGQKYRLCYVTPEVDPRSGELRSIIKIDSISPVQVIYLTYPQLLKAYLILKGNSEG